MSGGVFGSSGDFHWSSEWGSKSDYIILEAVHYTQVSPGVVSGAAKVSSYLEAVHYTQVSPGVVSGAYTYAC